MKTVVVDFSNLDDMSGFGEIARNYCPRLAAAAWGFSPRAPHTVRIP